ncbi:hypothetical protein [Nocardia iowensis]|uniref:Uncharacterized protein n=1 Tax=Nocardia iowensis TaxID=204891 RepID=A0ABX8RQL2_NOCIO|nr:hypothetical protein [Nocardia iowensis]QXN91888.1 hypothetical protein KV110_01460 [Nocardia iowensis]
MSVEATDVADSDYVYIAVLTDLFIDGERNEIDNAEFDTPAEAERWAEQQLRSAVATGDGTYRRADLAFAYRDDWESYKDGGFFDDTVIARIEDDNIISRAEWDGTAGTVTWQTDREFTWDGYNF